MSRPGLYANIHAKRKRGGKMRKKGAKGAPTAANFKRAAQTARKRGDDPSGVKRKDFRGSKAEGGLMEATARLKKQGLKGGGISQRGLGRAFMKGGRV
jgi:hypothetical protein